MEILAFAWGILKFCIGVAGILFGMYCFAYWMNKI